MCLLYLGSQDLITAQELWSMEVIKVSNILASNLSKPAANFGASTSHQPTTATPSSGEAATNTPSPSSQNLSHSRAVHLPTIHTNVTPRSASSNALPDIATPSPPCPITTPATAPSFPPPSSPLTSEDIAILLPSISDMRPVSPYQDRYNAVAASPNSINDQHQSSMSEEQQLNNNNNAGSTAASPRIIANDQYTELYEQQQQQQREVMDDAWDVHEFLAVEMGACQEIVGSDDGNAPDNSNLTTEAAAVLTGLDSNNTDKKKQKRKNEFDIVLSGSQQQQRECSPSLRMGATTPSQQGGALSQQAVVGALLPPPLPARKTKGELDAIFMPDDDLDNGKKALRVYFALEGVVFFCL